MSGGGVCGPRLEGSEGRLACGTQGPKRGEFRQRGGLSNFSALGGQLVSTLRLAGCAQRHRLVITINSLDFTPESRNLQRVLGRGEHASVATGRLGWAWGKASLVARTSLWAQPLITEVLPDALTSPLPEMCHPICLLFLPFCKVSRPGAGKGPAHPAHDQKQGLALTWRWPRVDRHMSK